MATLFDFASAGISALTPYKPGRPIDEVKRQYGLSEVIKLASNESPLGPSPAVIAAINAAASGCHRYPDGNAYYLKQALAQKHGCSVAQITVGNGTNELLSMLARLFLKPGVSAVYSAHAFIVYKLSVMMAGAEAIEVPAVDFGHDLAAIAAAISPSTRMVFLANPNNPTGTLFSEAQFTEFMALVPENVLVVLDEAYFDYVDPAVRFDGIDYVERYANLVVTRTFSKVYALGGLRIGYAISSQALADLLNRGREPFNVNAIAQVAATAALSDEAHIAQSVALNASGMRQLLDGFKALDLAVISSYANFITVDVGEGAAVAEKLLQQGVIVRAIGEYQLPHYIRISIGLASENQRLLSALQQVL